MGAYCRFCLQDIVKVPLLRAEVQSFLALSVSYSVRTNRLSFVPWAPETGTNESEL